MPQFIGNYAQIRRLPAFRDVSAPPQRLVGVTVADETIRPLEYFQGKLWGASASSPYSLYTSTNWGDTWTLVKTTNFSALAFSRLMPTSDGELIAHSTGEIFKSSGWAANPETATWVSKASSTDGGNTPFNRFGVHGNAEGTKFIAVEYGAGASNWVNSRKGFISLDSGTTWVQKWDSETINPGVGANSHIHGACYDPWRDRWWIAEGHGASYAGLYYSDDNGDTWTKSGATSNPAPTVIIPTEYGLVLGSDRGPSGIYHFPHTDDPENTSEYLAAKWKPPSVQDGVIGFAQRGYYDPDTGIVYVSFFSDFSSIPAVIMASDGLAASTIYTESANQGTIPNVVAKGANLVAHLTRSGNKFLKAKTQARGFSEIDPANVLGGTVGDAVSQSSMAVAPSATVNNSVNSIAVGPNANVHSSERSIAIGTSVQIGGRGSIGIGYAVDDTDQPDSVIIGLQPTTAGGQSVTIGSGTTGRASSVVIGHQASAGQSGCVAIGYQATTLTFLFCTAIGRQASCAGQNGFAGGYTANVASGHANSVAVGPVTTSASNQIQVGPRHLEFIESSDFAAPATDRARLYARDDGAGKTQLVVRFATGAIQVLATEP